MIAIGFAIVAGAWLLAQLLDMNTRWDTWLGASAVIGAAILLAGIARWLWLHT
jgi:hypothetical protein